jgi:hypothetical protein
LAFFPAGARQAAELPQDLVVVVGRLLGLDLPVDVGQQARDVEFRDVLLQPF